MEKKTQVKDEAQEEVQEEKKEKLIIVREIESVSKLFKDIFGGEILTDQVEVELVMSRRQGLTFAKNLAYSHGVYADIKEIENAGTMMFEIDGVQWKVFIKAK